MDDEEMIGERAYRAIKARVIGGAFRPGERLEPSRLKDETGASLTTVYSALRRLAAERLVVSSRSEGFHAPVLTEGQLRGSYRWACALAVLAVDNAAPAIGPPQQARGPIPAPEGADIVRRTEALFGWIAALPEIEEFETAMAHANDRLRAVRRLEAYLIGDMDKELEVMSAAVGDPQRLIARLAAYRDRRLLLVPDLARLRTRQWPDVNPQA